MITDEQAKDVISANLIRLRGDMSYGELARRCTTDDWKCYPATIQQIESKRHLPNAALLARIAEALGVTLDKILPVGLNRKKQAAHAVTPHLKRAAARA